MSPETVLLLLNHFFVVTDPGTCSAMRSASFLSQEFAPFEQRTTARNDTTYTGIYFYGRHTYFELFEPGSQGPLGTSGIAFGVETPGASSGVRAAWEKALGGAETTHVTRRTETDEVPWFQMTYAAGLRDPATPNGPPGLRTWLMEYEPDFLARWYPDLTPARSIVRSDVLDRYVARIGQSVLRDDFLLKDVVGLTLALPEAQRDPLVHLLKASGYTAREKKGGTVLEGPEVTLKLVSGAGPQRGVVEVEFSLQRRVGKRQEQFGLAALVLEGERALLRFGRSGAAR
jgi:hypothetical protein